MGRCASFHPSCLFLPIPIVSVFTFGRALKKDVELHSKVGRANRTGGRRRRREVGWRNARARAIRPSLVRPAVPAAVARTNVGPKRGKGGREGLFISAPRRPTFAPLPPVPSKINTNFSSPLLPSFLPRVELLVALKSPCRCCLPALSVGTAFAGNARVRQYCFHFWLLEKASSVLLNRATNHLSLSLSGSEPEGGPLSFSPFLLVCVLLGLNRSP